ncbi:MAG: small multi-drug export protein [Desulfobacteraceae bacterium]|nr:small multi-drug export protein [Desulfobacteraceae bacterium]
MAKGGIETDKPSLSAGNGASAGGLHFRLLAEPEGQILLAGLGLATVSILALTVGLFRSPDTAQLLMGMTASHVFFGRAAGMSFGYTLGFDHALVISVNMLIETILVLLFYPLFVFSWRRLLVLSFLKNFMERSHRSAEKNRDKIRKYGIPGLLAFVWLPFWMTGPLMGCIIGFLMGLRQWTNMLVVLTGTFLAILGYAAVLKGLHTRLSLINPYAPFVLLAILVLIAIAASLLHNGRSRKP